MDFHYFSLFFSSDVVVQLCTHAIGQKLNWCHVFHSAKMRCILAFLLVPKGVLWTPLLPPKILCRFGVIRGSGFLMLRRMPSIVFWGYFCYHCTLEKKRWISHSGICLLQKVRLLGSYMKCPFVFLLDILYKQWRELRQNLVDHNFFQMSSEVLSSFHWLQQLIL